MADYRNYGDWKGWGGDTFMHYAPIEGRYFAAELSGRSLDGADVLEIGFGNGNFLGWAASQGARLYGTELIPEAVELARARGVQILPLDLASAASDHGGRFDVVVAFDVLEHLTREQLIALLEAVALLLKPGGVFVARFPNGQSPFGRVFQHADLTHVSTLSAPMIDQLIAGLPLTMLYGRDPKTVYGGGTAVRSLKRVKGLGRAAIEKCVKFLYDFDAPMSVNVVVALEKPVREPAKVSSRR